MGEPQRTKVFGITATYAHTNKYYFSYLLTYLLTYLLSLT